MFLISHSREHTRSLDARKAVAQSRKSRGFFDVILRRSRDTFRPTYNYKPDGGACRVYGSMAVKKVTGKLIAHFLANRHLISIVL